MLTLKLICKVYEQNMNKAPRLLIKKPNSSFFSRRMISFKAVIIHIFLGNSSLNLIVIICILIDKNSSITYPYNSRSLSGVSFNKQRFVVFITRIKGEKNENINSMFTTPIYRMHSSSTKKLSNRGTKI